MSARKQSGSFTPNKGTTKPNPGMSKIRAKVYTNPTNAKYIRLLEAALMVAFLIFVKVLLLYYWLYCKSERLRWRLLLIMPTRKSKNE